MRKPFSLTAVMLAVLLYATPCLAGGSASDTSLCAVSLVAGSAVTATSGQVSASIVVTGASGCLGFIEVSVWGWNGSSFVLQNATTTGYGVGSYTVTATTPSCSFKVILTNPPNGNEQTDAVGPVLGSAQGGSGTCQGLSSTTTLNSASTPAGTIPDTGATGSLGPDVVLIAVSFALALLNQRKNPRSS
jgi:hypothetical protein